jgi:hypothetical protein
MHQDHILNMLCHDHSSAIKIQPDHFDFQISDA